MAKTAEHTRLLEDGAKWKHWGPYLSERQWGTVHEDYSANGAGLGASHQTGWTGAVAKLIQIFGAIDPKQLLEAGLKGSCKAQTGHQAGHMGSAALPVGQPPMPRKGKTSRKGKAS